MLYKYKARDKQGGLISGTMEAEGEKAIFSELEKLGYGVIAIESGEKSALSAGSILERFKPVKKRDVILFTRQLATLLRSGTALSPSLAAVTEQTTNKKFKAILENISQSVEGGESLSDSLSKHPRLFPELFISMVKVGEAGGMLDNVLDRLSALGTQEMEMQSRLTSALVYPVVLVVVAFVVINFLIIGVLPKFVVVFSASGAELPIPTKIILGVSWTLQKLWLPIFIAAILGIVWFNNHLKNNAAKEAHHARLLKVPLFGELYAKVQISRFARITSALIASGIPLLQALDVVEKTLSNLVIRRAIRNIKTAVAEGHSLVEPFKASKVFNPMVVQMIATGEKSGNLDQMLQEICGFYDPEIEYTIKNLTALLEPFMLLVMGGMVAFIALSVLLPIFNLIKVFRG